MPVQPLEEIEVYVMAEEIADKWWEIVSRWTPFAQDTVGKQLIRAVDSIGSNIAESYGRYHFGEKINHLIHAARFTNPNSLRTVRENANW